MTPSHTSACSYFIRSCDPSGEFLISYWETAELPRVGEDVMLPDDDNWQEMTVTEIRHYPHGTEVWLGGADGWEEGSVLRLFRGAQKLVAPDYLSECGHAQPPPTDEEIVGCPDIIVRVCSVCGQQLWWNVDQWKRV